MYMYNNNNVTCIIHSMNSAHVYNLWLKVLMHSPTKNTMFSSWVSSEIFPWVVKTLLLYMYNVQYSLKFLLLKELQKAKYFPREKFCKNNVFALTKTMHTTSFTCLLLILVMATFITQ